MSHDLLLDTVRSLAELNKAAGFPYDGNHKMYVGYVGEGDVDLGISRVAGRIQAMMDILVDKPLDQYIPSVVEWARHGLAEARNWVVFGKKDGSKAKKLDVGGINQAPIFKLKSLSLNIAHSA